MLKSFADLEFAKKRLTLRDRFLVEIDRVTPWDELHKLVGSFHSMVAWHVTMKRSKR